MEVTLVHPTDKDKKVIATHPQQVVAYEKQGFVVEASKNEDSGKKAEKGSK